MAGRKVFTAGEVLQAADVNDYLMDQSVMVFAGTAARGSAIPSPTEGMVTYRSDDDVVEVFDGSAFVGVAVAPAILQVQSAASTATFSTSSTSFVLYTSVEVSITPSSASNTVMVFANVAKATNTSNGPQQFMEVQRGGSAIFTTSAHGDGTSGYYAPMVIMFEDSPASTSAQTYSLKVRVNGGTGSFEGASITVMEVAA